MVSAPISGTGVAGGRLAPGDRFELRVVDLNHSGDGVGRHEGFVFFVPGALPGERVAVEVDALHKRYGRARLVEVLEASPDRVAPPCPVYAGCGGCQLQHLSYPAELVWKRRRVEAALQRVGGLQGVAVEPVWGMPSGEPWGYRNKVQFPAGVAGGRLVLGFYRRGSHELVPTGDCLIQSPGLVQAAGLCRRLADEAGLEPYDEYTGQGFLRHVVVRESSIPSQILVAWVTHTAAPIPDTVVEGLVAGLPGLAGVVQNVQPEASNRILGSQEHLLWGRPYLEEHLGPFRFRLSIRSFFQVNRVQAERLYRLAVELAAPEPADAALDGYCGVGGITFFLAQEARFVWGVEENRQAVSDARENARRNRIGNARFAAARLEEWLPRRVREGFRPNVAVVDPPRSGVRPEALDALAASTVRRLAYVSCDPETLARDLAHLVRKGYRVERVQPVDMFPRTAHVEAVAQVRRGR
ncbi:23S rRNA (uracil(1939)-C(5))-methyltransferase RlmD [Limnochorda pilosa]|uniref:RNA methyltransferase n=1 Tax=Limnochorda pilosa TaxID=1555112 RepID=A0A0K2SJE8_LIMPI|nr:23S rRNA (uracil(1939)-C(5))-methyltransferase RlmD [Limnochorda pilosa]BAS27228.1 RNA methyltransferase [Limnochorda pilosa]